jgi:hypothetical protein
MGRTGATDMTVIQMLDLERELPARQQRHELT